MGYGFPSFCHVLVVKIPYDGFGCFATGSDGSDGDSRTGLQVTTGKNTFSIRCIGDGVDFGGAPAGDVQARHILDGRKIRVLADGGDKLVDLDVIFTARYGHRPSSSG